MIFESYCETSICLSQREKIAKLNINNNLFQYEKSFEKFVKYL